MHHGIWGPPLKIIIQAHLGGAGAEGVFNYDVEFTSRNRGTWDSPLEITWGQPL